MSVTDTGCRGVRVTGVTTVTLFTIGGRLVSGSLHSRVFFTVVPSAGGVTSLPTSQARVVAIHRPVGGPDCSPSVKTGSDTSEGIVSVMGPAKDTYFVLSRYTTTLYYSSYL